MVVDELSVWTSLGLHYKVGHCICVMCILTKTLVVPSFVLWVTTTPCGPGEHGVGAVKIHKTCIYLQLYNVILNGIGLTTLIN